MPLDFTDPDPPTLGRKRSASEAEQQLRREFIKTALRTLGGTMKVAVEDRDQERVERYVEEYERRDREKERGDNGYSEFADGVKFTVGGDVAPPPPGHKVYEYRHHYAQGKGVITPGWLPYAYRPCSEGESNGIARMLSKDVDSSEPIVKMRSNPGVSVMYGNEANSVVVKDGDVIWKMSYPRRMTHDFETSHMADIVFKDVNHGIVAVGMAVKRKEREWRQSRST